MGVGVSIGSARPEVVGGNHEEVGLAVYCEDLALRSKFRESLSGVAALVTHKLNELEGVSLSTEGVVVLDLHSKRVPLEQLIALGRALVGAVSEGRVIAFFSHVQAELGQEGLRLGADIVLPRSKIFNFVAELAQKRRGV